MSYLAVTILYMIKVMNKNRTAIGAFHILKGKKSAQTLQDCHLFKLDHLFGVLSELTRSQFEKEVSRLVANRDLRECEERGKYEITLTGEKVLNDTLNIDPLPYLNGFQYHDIAKQFWIRLALITQCLSHLKVNKHTFIPTTKDVFVQRWIKAWLLNNKDERLGNFLYEELKELLLIQPEVNATIFVHRLTGSHRVGLTMEQIAEQLNLDRIYSSLLFQSVLHTMTDEVIKKKDTFPLLYSLIADLKKKQTLTNSALKTYNLLQKGCTMEEVCKVRRLKRNTIEDHIVEIALNISNFCIDEYVSNEEQWAILDAIQRTKSYKLKDIMEHLNFRVSYFAIRLTIAKKGIAHGT